MKPRIVLAGGSGFIGQSLSPFLLSKNYEVIVLTRAESDQRGALRKAHWDGKAPGDWIQFVNGAAAVVNLTGRSINCRHTSENRREIIDSRVDSVRVLGQAIERCAQPLQDAQSFVATRCRAWSQRRFSRGARQTDPLVPRWPGRERTAVYQLDSHCRPVAHGIGGRRESGTYRHF